MEDKYKYNILNWYHFKKNSKILEIIYNDSFLNNNHTVVEIKNINNIKEKYDYVVMIDVLQHASDYYTDDPYTSLISSTKQLLKKNGILLLAINNRFGLKYLSGFPEDDTNIPYEGLLGYKNSKGIRTFTKKELNKVTNIYKNRLYYYPYPNYYLPEEIFTDSSINKIIPSSINGSLKKDIFTVFDEKEMNKEFMKNNMADFFANSFLLELSDKEIKKQADYIKISSNRNDCFSIFTELFYDKKIVIKKNIYDCGTNHLKNMSNIKEWNSGILETIKYKWNNNKIICDLLEAKSLSYYLDYYIENRDIKSFWSLLTIFKNNIYLSSKSNSIQTKQFNEVFGNSDIDIKMRWAKSGNVDLKTDNIFIKNNKWFVIDDEWVFSFPIPEEYMLWYSLDYYYNTNIECQKQITYTEIIDFIEIDEHTLKAFNNWRNYFIYNYVGTKDRNYKANDVIDLSIIKELKKKEIAAEQIINSKIWKISKPLRYLLDRIKGK